MEVSGPLRWSYSFKPLIGGPSFLPLHISTRVTLERDGAPGILLDFLPEAENISADTTRALIAGQSIPGKLRMTYDGGNGDSGDEERALKALGTALLDDTQKLWANTDLELNLYTRNCYHLAFYLTLVLLRGLKR